MLNGAMLVVLFCPFLLQEEGKLFAEWVPIEKGESFDLKWTFQLSNAGRTGERNELLKDIRKVKAKLVAENDIDGKGQLRIRLTHVTWKFVTPQYDLDLVFRGGTVTRSVRARTEKEKARGHQMASELERFIKREHTFPVGNKPVIVGGAWSGAGMPNGLFDWMIFHGALDEDGPVEGDTWEVKLDSREMVGRNAPPDFYSRKMKMEAKKSGRKLKVAGSMSWSFKDLKNTGGPITGKHSVRREWYFDREGYFSGGMREISGSRKVSPREKSRRSSTSYSLKEKLEIKKE